MIGSVECTLKETTDSQSPYDELFAEIFWTKRSLETGKIFNLDDLRNQGHEISPYLAIQKLEKFVQIQERVHPLLIRDFYHNAQQDDFKTGNVTYAGEKEIHLTEELFAEALDIPLKNRKIFESDWYDFSTSHLYILKSS